jgi:hypothetical protein
MNRARGHRRIRTPFLLRCMSQQLALFGPAEAAGRCQFSRVDRKSSADGENDANDPEPTISRFLDFDLVAGQREFQDQL